MYALKNCQIYTGFNVLDHHAIIIENDKIADVCHENNIPKNAIIDDLAGAFVAPGFIDIQLNGCGGVQFNETLDALSIETLEKMQQINVKSGCTNFLPTLITSPDNFMIKAVETMHAYVKKHKNQALGLHIEGPYISKLKKGIHNPDYIRKPTPAMIRFLCDHADVIKMITLAPEEIDTKDIQRLADAGIKIAVGHSNASYQECLQGFDAGISMATHLFNAMPPLTGRDPGVIGAVYDTPDVYAGIIADGLHVHWSNIRLSHQIKKNKLILTTDAMLLAGTDISSGIFAGKRIFNKKGQCVDEQGTLGGSSLVMIDAIANAVNHVGIALDEALRMATLYPAEAMGYSNQFGSITREKIANLVIFDHNFSLIKTIVNGQLSH